MKNMVNISKSNKLLRSQDYSLLLKEGRKFIEKFSNEQWTDYNTHDPGITILEVLCYAITELGYKTAFDIKDLLIERENETFKDLFQFFTARSILLNKPVTFNDYRKLLIDMDGVRNAWLNIVRNPMPSIWLNCDKSLLIHEKKLSEYPEDDNKKEIKIRGLYDVTMELDKHEKYGDLNELFVEKTIKKNNQDFTFLVDLPSWSYFFDNNIVADDFSEMEFTTFSADAVNRRLYNAKLKIKLSDRTFTVNVKVHSTKKHSTVRDDIIKNLILATGKTSIVKEYLSKLKAALIVVESVFANLHANRNLCEDFNTLKGLETEKIGICADIEVQALADNEKVLAEIYYRIERFIAPYVNFYSFEELAGKGKRTEEIFEGPPLNHGFIDDKELKNSEPRKEIMVSDMIQIIMDVKGVQAVKNITLASRYKQQILNSSVNWCLKVKEGLIPRFERARSEIVLHKENIPYYPVDEEVEEYLEEYHNLERKQKLSKDELYDFPVPKGNDLSVQDYYSIQDDFPLTYGTGKKGIPGLITEKRKAQAKQLKAYLLFFDQLLANYFSQLYHVKNLFSYSTQVDKTYFYKILYNLPHGFAFSAGNKAQSVLFNDEQLPMIYHLIKDFVDKNNPDMKPSINLDDYASFKTEWIDYKKKSGFESPGDKHFVKSLDEIVEDTHTFENRRNRFLDHVAARFGEQFSDYVMLMYTLDAKKAPGELIDDKAVFLQEYPIISSERGKAFNYKDETAVWNTDNVAGLKKRISRILGIDSYKRAQLSCNPLNSYFENYKDDSGKLRFRIKDNEENMILDSKEFNTNTLRQKGIQLIKTLGKNQKHYYRKVTGDRKYNFEIQNKDKVKIATSIDYPTRTARERAIKMSLSIFNGECNFEGFHLVEHLLLRPLTEDDYLMDVCVEKDCDSCFGEMDPYSFRITLIIPYWPRRFDNMEFRKFFEKTVHLETPAHIHPKICWADKPDIVKFEKAYRDWLTEKAKKHPDQTKLSDRTKDLIKIMNNIRSVYPIATLHDCYDGKDENIVVLNQSILGTFKPDKDGID